MRKIGKIMFGRIGSLFRTYILSLKPIIRSYLQLTAGGVAGWSFFHSEEEFKLCIVSFDHWIGFRSQSPISEFTPKATAL
jgi:hypothetical protein